MHKYKLGDLIVRWGPAFVLMKTIYFASGLPADRIPDLAGIDDVVKKGGHAVGFSLLALALLRGLGSHKRHAREIAFGLTFIYAVSDESHQMLTPGRTPSLTDIGIDMTGAVIALLLHKKIKLVQKLTDAFLPPAV